MRVPVQFGFGFIPISTENCYLGFCWFSVRRLSTGKGSTPKQHDCTHNGGIMQHDVHHRLIGNRCPGTQSTNPGTRSSLELD